ncbi:MAG: triphosphoribosyl-dephospho-CoA synthase [Candidatus Heimdallarchaeota archaeon]
MNPLPDNIKRLTNYIRMCGELACLLEVSATPKPGNVHRFRDFEDTKYEDFLAASVAFGKHLEELSMKGLQLKERKISWNQITLGKNIYEAIKESDFFHLGGNTNLGIILLLAPLSIAAGMSIKEKNDDFICDIMLLQNNVIEVMINSTVDDAINVSNGIAYISPGGLGNVEKFDVTNPDLREELEANNTSLVKLMGECKDRDNICFELALGFPITFGKGIKTLEEAMIRTGDINLAIIDTYLEILSSYPDTLIKRKFGAKKAMEIATRASAIIKLGGAATVEGRRELEEFDIELREEEEKINPGTTADLIAAIVFVYLLCGGKLRKIRE